MYESIDGLSEMLRGSWSKFCKDFRNACLNNKKYTKIDTNLDPKAFLVHIIHAIQDWGLFEDYMGISHPDNKRLFRKTRRRDIDPTAWTTYVGIKSVDLTRYLGTKFNNDNYRISEEIAKIHNRKENSIFLRKFDTYCCNIQGEIAPSSGKRKIKNDEHDFIIDLNNKILLFYTLLTHTRGRVFLPHSNSFACMLVSKS